MFQRFHHRLGHYLLLLLVAVALFLINLGGPSLWDIDEGNNAEAAREMLESDNWIVPTCNYQLRVDKPALLYWLQIGAYRIIGVNEFAARLPSALAALLTVLLTYELGRRQFGAAVGLLAGLVLASTMLFCAAAHFANPDALLNLFSLLTMLIFWIGFDSGWRGWFVAAGASSGLAVLAKGPVGLVLPAAVAILFLLGVRRLRLLWDRWLLLGSVAFVLVAVPWYAWVGVETKTDFLQGFFFKHNVDRFLSPMENHRGPIFYYLAVLLVGYLPWSLLLVPAVWDAVKTLRSGGRGRDDSEDIANCKLQIADCKLGTAVPFLLCWIMVYVVFFSMSRTKLPNYVLPVAAPVSILIARYLTRWRTGVLGSDWALRMSLVGLLLIGVGTSVGLLLAGGAIEAPFLRGGRFPGLEAWAAVGMLPVVGAAAAWWLLRRDDRRGVVVAYTLTAVLFVGALAGHGGVTLDAYKAPKALAGLIEAPPNEPDIRVGAHNYFQPSLIFYCQREVRRLESEQEALEFLQYPLPVYLVLPERTWEQLQAQVEGPHRLLGRQRDLYRNFEVVVVTNR